MLDLISSTNHQTEKVELRTGAGLGMKGAAEHLLSLPGPSQTKDLLVPPLRICLIKLSGFVRSLKSTRKNKLKTQACFLKKSLAVKLIVYNRFL